MSGMHAGPWLILPAQKRLTPAPLPTGAPLTARAVHAAYWAFTEPARAELRRGHFGSRLVSRAFDQLDAISPAPVHLTRRERTRGAQYLIDLDARTGGVL